METRLIEKLESFFSKYTKQNFRKGEILVRADDDPSGVTLLKKGNVKQYAVSREGEEIIVNIFKPNSFFPMSWAINLTPNKYYFEAMMDVSALSAPREDVIKFLKKEPGLLFDLLSRVYIGTDGMQDRMVYLMSGSAYSRLISEIIIQVKRFGKKENGRVVVRISEKDLAAQTGLTRETVSREIKILKDKRLVEFAKNTLTILNTQKLEKELSE